MTSYETAHDVFVHHNLAEIQTISATLKQLAQERHQALQSLVNGKYRDLLTTADLIMDMEQISKRQDTNLYELSFLKDVKLDKLIKIEDNIQFFYKDEDEINYEGGKSSVLINSENFLKFSKFLNIGNDDDIISIIEQLKEFELPILKGSWFYERRDTILDKFKYLFDIIHDQLNHMNNIDELKQVYEYLNQLVIFDDEKCDMKRFNAKYLEIFIRIVENNDGDLDDILGKFEFKDQLKMYYSNKLRNLFNELDDIDLNLQNDELKLYELTIDDNYLYNIKMLNNGLIYSSQRHFNNLLIIVIKTLNILKKLGLDETETVLKYVDKLNGNKKLVKYKEKLQTSLRS